MAQYVLVNRRSGLFTNAEKTASRASVPVTLGLLTTARVIAERRPADPLARHVVLLDADAEQVANLHAQLPADSILEPVVRRRLHKRIPPGLGPALPHTTAVNAATNNYRVTITGGGAPLPRIDVMLYLRDTSGRLRTTIVQTDTNGGISFPLPAGSGIAFVEPIPYAGFWIMLAAAPPSGGTIDCLPIAKAKPGGRGWWHDAMGIDVTDATRGRGIRVGVIDTGCGPHRNLSHVTLVGAFIDGLTSLPSQGRDVAEHGTHTSGIIGARPSRASDYAGLAPGCDLLHARVFKDEDAGVTQADLINAIDSLSRDHHCDLINMSLGGGPPSKAEEDAIKDARERGTLCICSAGNEHGPIEFPGAYPECEAVSAIGLAGWAPPGTFSSGNRPQEPGKAGRNNLFLAAFSCFGPALACAGPGVGIVSTVPDRNGFTGAYMEMDGTSMASPAVCGVLAVILSKDAAYKALPRNISRSKRAELLLAQHCKPFGLLAKFEGRGLPVV
jgi:subtilisin